MTLLDLVTDYSKISFILDNLEDFILSTKQLLIYYEKTKVAAEDVHNRHSPDNYGNEKTITRIISNYDYSVEFFVLFREIHKEPSLKSILIERDDLFPQLSEFVKLQYDKLYKPAKELLHIPDLQFIHDNRYDINIYLDVMISTTKELVNNYDSIKHDYIYINDVYNSLLEQVPENVRIDDYTEIVIRSFAKTISLRQITASLNYLTETIESIIDLLPKDVSKNYYVRKIETGSLVTLIAGSFILLKTISKFIDWSLDTYNKYQEKNLNYKKVRLEIIGLEIDNLEKLTRMKIVSESQKDIIDKALHNTIKYYKLNEEVDINGKHYIIKGNKTDKNQKNKKRNIVKKK